MLLVLVGIVEVSAITSNEVTYENEGISETLTNTIDTLYNELKEYRTNGSVTSSKMLEGYAGYAKGKLINGSIPSKGSTTYTPGVNNQVINKGQYLSENQVILGDSNLRAENIKSGVEIFGIKGTIKDNSGKTLEATHITRDESYTYLNIPQEAIYNTSSVVKVANSELYNDLIFKKYTIITENGFVSSSTNECWANKYFAQIILTIKIPTNISAGWIRIGTIQSFPYQIQSGIVRMAVTNFNFGANEIVYRDVSIANNYIDIYVESSDSGKYVVIDVTRILK